MKLFSKILTCATLLSSCTLFAPPTPSPTPNWSNPFPVYSTPDTQNAINQWTVDGNTSGSKVLIYSKNTVNSFGVSARINSAGLITYPLNSTPLNEDTYAMGSNSQNNTVSINDNGNALGIWIMNDTLNNRPCVQSILLTNNTWGIPSILSNVQYSYSWSNGFCFWNHAWLVPSAPQAKLHNDGSAIALWREISSDYSNYAESALRFNILNANGNWEYDGSSDSNSGSIGNAWLISNDPDAGNPLLLDTQTSTNASPKAVCAYQGNNGNIYISNLQNNSGFTWTTPTPSSCLSAGPFGGAMNSSGIFAVAYVDNATNNIQVCSNISGFNTEQTACIAPSLIQPLEGSINYSVSNIAVAIDTNNSITVLFTAIATANPPQFSFSSVHAIRYSNGTWDINPTTLQSYPGNEIYFSFPNLGVDSNGNIFAAWEQDTLAGKGTIYYNYYNGTNWIETNAISNSEISATNPILKVASNGNATVTWVKNNLILEAVSTTLNTYQPETTWFECTSINNSNGCA